MRYEELARQVLRIGPEASEDEIVRAARAMIRRHHPDVGGTSLGLRCVLAARATLLPVRRAA